MRRVPLLLAAVFLSGCATESLVTDSSCRSFRPITHSKADTEQTRREVVAHNRVFDTLCPSPSAEQKLASR
jgi:PBP1b-binding outer membrane lipoprotein LpoB